MVSLIGVAMVCVLLFLVGYAVIYMNGYKIMVENDEKFRMAEASAIYDRHGEKFADLYTQNRKLVTLDEVPDLLEQAIIATEDQRFYEHPGVDFWAIGRAIVKDIVARDLVEGGSTITQQLAKNMFLTADKTFFRKATEMSIAVAMENSFTKDEILERYLNYIYYGNGAYGVQAAAEKHFGVSDLNDLTLLEIAVLAGMPKAPETYSPTNNPERAVERASVVLKLMVDQGYITEEERQEALNSELRKPAKSTGNAVSAMKDYVLSEAARVTGLSENELRIGGYHIYTTIDSKAQRAVDKAFSNPELFPEDGPEQIVQGAMVIIDPKTGGIAAMNGGREYVEKGLNRALVDRQPGSAFKPIAVYAPALETGEWFPYSKLKDEKISYGNYTPTNLSGRYQGEVTFYEAVQRSLNAPTVWLLNEIGVDTGYRFAQKLGIDLEASDRNLAIALGGLTKGASPLEMARAYGAFANGGLLAETFVIAEVKDSNGITIYKHTPKVERVMSEEAAYYTTYLLQSVTQPGGTGRRANFGRPVAGKTGTTQIDLPGVSDSSGNRDIWFVGYTPQYAAAVWMGFDKTDASHYVKSGSGTAAHMFATVMKEAMEGMEVLDFERPSAAQNPTEIVEEPPEAEVPVVAQISAEYLAEAQSPQVLVSWAGVESEERFEYRLYRKEASEDQFQLIFTTAETSIIDLSVLPGHTYQYYVTVYLPDEDLEGEPSMFADAAVPELDPGVEGEFPDGFPEEGIGEEGAEGEGSAGEDEGAGEGAGTGEEWIEDPLGPQFPEEPELPGDDDAADVPVPDEETTELPQETQQPEVPELPEQLEEQQPMSLPVPEEPLGGQ